MIKDHCFAFVAGKGLLIHDMKSLPEPMMSNHHDSAWLHLWQIGRTVRFSSVILYNSKDYQIAFQFSIYYRYVFTTYIPIKI